MIGRQLGSYHIVSLLGTGGMGEVYLARDTKLGRNVAIKVLPSSFATDSDRLTRFAREARLLAALNHPHVATIHGFEETDGVRALVMELVEGPTLADKLSEGSHQRTPAGLSLDDALRIGGQIAEALEAAHERGVIHRDLKPANIKLTRDGSVKILDFGLAKAFSNEAGEGDASGPPTMTTASLQGAVIGTPAYMSPEQARGQAIDKRTDIWGFGCVLYELLTGRRAFAGSTSSDAIAAILEREPDWSALPAYTPAGIRLLLRRCLAKDPKRRLRDIGDARLDVEYAQSAPQPTGPEMQAPARSNRLPWALAIAALALAAAATGAWMLRPAPASVPEVRFDISTLSPSHWSLAISPDGLKVVFADGSAGRSQLWVRSLDSSVARPLKGTERGWSAFWSPDSRSIGFFADSKLIRLDIDRGALKTLVPVAPAPLGGAWNSDGTIIFSASPGQPVFRISAEGGEPIATTRFESGRQRTHSYPQFLPDGRHFLFFVTGSAEGRGVYVGQLEGLESRRLFDADSPAVYTAATRHLLFVREGKVLAQSFDPDRLETIGDPFPFLEHLTGGAALSASDAGHLVYRATAADSGHRQLKWVDRSGTETAKVVYADTSPPGPSLSLDGRHVAVFRYVNGNMDIWSYDTSRRAWDRMTSDPGDDIFPLWSPDGTRLVFGSRRGSMDLYWKPLSAPLGSGEELLLSSPEPKFPMDWSRDGRFLLYNTIYPNQGLNISVLPLDGDRTPRDVVRTDFQERLPQFSPDGKWIAYESDKTGRFEIYIRPFPGPGTDTPASIEGGTHVRWNANGKELFYIAADDRLMAVPIRLSATGDVVEPSTPVPLFAANVGSAATNTNRQLYAVAPDAQSFVLNTVAGETPSNSPITVILNWKPQR